MTLTPRQFFLIAALLLIALLNPWLIAGSDSNCTAVDAPPRLVETLIVPSLYPSVPTWLGCAAFYWTVKYAGLVGEDAPPLNQKAAP